MSASTPASPGNDRRAFRRAALLRLAGLALLLVVLFIVGGIIGLGPLRSAIDPLGWFGPIAYVAASSILGALLVPGPVLASLSGALFGAVTGSLVNVAGTIGTSVAATWFGARAAGRSVDDLADSLEGKSRERSEAVLNLLRHNAFAAVVVQRLIPGVPDAPFCHAFGAAGVPVRTVAIAAALVSSPRAVAYAIIGANADDLLGPGALVGWGINVAMGIVGIAVALWLHRRHRRSARAKPTAPTE